MTVNFKHHASADTSPLSDRLPAEPGQRTCPPDAVPTDLLFRGRQEILIGHKGETYRLRITRNDKLILTK